MEHNVTKHIAWSLDDSKPTYLGLYMSTLVYHTYTKLSNFSRFGRHLRRLDIKVYKDRYVLFIDRVAADFFG
jgi:hypothetical protein